MVAISPTGDSRQAVREYVLAHGYTFTTAVGGLDGTRWTLLGVNDFGIVDRYGIASYPTTLVLDRTGKILARLEAFDEAAIRAALKQAGLRDPR